MRAQSQLLLVEFVNSEIQLGFTFAEFAATERGFGNFEHFQHAKLDAEKALQTIRKFLDRIASPETRTAVANRCVELERVIAGLAAGV